MFGKQSKRQTGFALLIFLVIMMGIGGIALTGVTQGIKKEVDQKIFDHNKEVLNRAKQALLMFAYNYPVASPTIGPGRLPCPDITNNGLIGSGVDTAQCEKVGRLPFNDPRLNFFETKDASGERLWYAVSGEFRNVNPTDVGSNINGDDVVNSESEGTISIFDQSGNLLYDGAISGVAAVIIAPGPPISRDEDNDGIYEVLQVRGTTAEKIEEKNYLESFNGFDNSAFNNGFNTAASGFILGPIREPDSTSPAFNTIVVNDQMVVITSKEIIAMAEKSVLETYKNSINQYKANIGINRYPWLDPYESADGLTTFDAVAPTLPLPPPLEPVIGRLPSIFTNYFDNTAVSSESFISDLNIEVNVNGFVVPYLGVISSDASMEFNSSGDLLVTSSSSDLINTTRHFWDEVLPPSGWQECPFVTGTESDCNQTSPGTFDPLALNVIESRVVRVAPNINLSNGVQFNRLYNNNILVFRAPTATTHAEVLVELPDTDPGVSGVLEVSIGYDDSYLNTFDTVPQNYLLGIRYYPELPNWVLTNNWHNSVLMAYSAAVQPGGDGTCTGGLDDCLTLDNAGGVTTNKLALLIQSGADINGGVDTGLVDGLDDSANLPANDNLGIGGGSPDYFSDDLPDIFEGQNNTSPVSGDLVDQLTFEKPINGNGNDVILVLE
jgi:hypothetical protein